MKGYNRVTLSINVVVNDALARVTEYEEFNIRGQITGRKKVLDCYKLGNSRTVCLVLFFSFFLCTFAILVKALS